MMESVNQLSDLPALSKTGYLRLLNILNPYAPHITEELWQLQGQKGLLSSAPWPAYDESLTKLEEVEYPVQIDGKIRFRLILAADLGSEEVLTAVRGHERYGEFLSGKSIAKEIVVPGRLVSLVTGPPPVDK
jgi:leucyl-tRNA synthetase